MITRNAWDDTNAIGNTISNFFSGIDGLEFANIYFRSALPNNKLCSRYFRITEAEVLKKWFSPRKIGKRFICEVGNRPLAQSSSEKKEKRMVHLIHKYGVSMSYKLSNYIWYSEKWINRSLESFVESFAPDLIFTFVRAAPQYYLTVRHLREKYQIPLLTWIADDEYSGLKKKGTHREIRNLKYILQESEIVTGCSEEICDYYNSVFGSQAVPMYKGCDLSVPVKNTVGQPVRIVYAGNMLYGRLDILKQIAQILESSAGRKAHLDIYSNHLLSSEDEAYFAAMSCTRFLGRKDYERIKQDLSAADVVLHVESFDEEQLLKTRYSFSTKIIDGLQSGSVLLAVGPEEQASIRYISRIPGTCVICDPLRLREELISFLDDAGSFCKRAQTIRSFALQNHNAEVNLVKMKTMLIKTVGGEA